MFEISCTQFIQKKISEAEYEFLLLPVLGALVGIFFSSLMVYLRLGSLSEGFLPLSFGLSAAGFIFGLRCSIHHRFMRIGRLKGKSHID